MADKNITLRQKNTSGVYDKLYTKTTATQSKLSSSTATLFGNDITDADAALAAIADTVKTLGYVQLKITDKNNNPLEGIVAQGLQGNPSSDKNGSVYGVAQNNTITLISNYADIPNKTVDVSSFVGSVLQLVVQMDNFSENSIVRYTSSKNIKFSKMLKTVDVCCVGGGGAGGSMAFNTDYTNLACGGGGGGGIVNATNIAVTPLIDNSLIVGSGGNYKDGGYTGGNGGTSSFLNIVANGGFGGIGKIGGNGNLAGGNSGAVGCGNGGNGEQNGGDSTVSEFNDTTTYYSGGGGGGSASQSGSAKTGGSPNGANGARFTLAATNAKGPGGGGGGAFGYRPDADSTGYSAKGSSGGPGLVAIRFHF